MYIFVPSLLSATPLGAESLPLTLKFDVLLAVEISQAVDIFHWNILGVLRPTQKSFVPSGEKHMPSGYASVVFNCMYLLL